MKLIPTKKHNIPFYMTFYWLLLWIIVAVIIYVYTLDKAQNGQVLKRDCLRKSSSECTLYSRQYSVPVGLEAGSQIITAGIVIGFFVLVGGFSQIILKKK